MRTAKSATTISMIPTTLPLVVFDTASLEPVERAPIVTFRILKNLITSKTNGDVSGVVYQSVLAAAKDAVSRFP